MSSSASPEIVTLGCRLNLAESEAIRALAGERPLAVVNSCAVTGEAVKQTRAAVRRLRRAHPMRELVVTGCAATLDPAGFAAMPEVDRVVPNDAKTEPGSWGGTAAPARFTGHARALLPVQTGCDHACTFCAIRHARGPSRSVPAAQVVAAARDLAAAGHREIVLTGVDLTSYADGNTGLGALCEALLAALPTATRLRLSSIDPIEIDEPLFAVLTQADRMAPHVHLSLQAGDDLILKRMRRRHLRDDAVRLVERLRSARPAIAIGADLIAGFPTEGDAAFANTLRLLDDAHIVHAHIFPFSPREGTPAARMPQVPVVVARERAARLRARAAERKAAWLAEQVGGTAEVLIERPGDRGHSDAFAEIHLPSPAAVGALLPVRITAATPTHLIGEPA